MRMWTIVPGDAFGTDDFIRISFATSMSNLQDGMARIADALAKLKPAPKRKLIKLANTETVVKHALEVEGDVRVERRDALVAEAEAELSYRNYFEWNANINGMIVNLRTNVGISTISGWRTGIPRSSRPTSNHMA
jgi:hypothetical protein